MGQTYAVKIPAIGEHWLQNASAALAVAVNADIKMQDAVAALENYVIPAGRGVAFNVEIDGKSVHILDESYNANPTSMRAAFTSAARQRQPGGRLIAVLGDMFELGKDEIEIHASLAPDIEAANIDRVIFAGECMRALRGAVRRERRGLWVRDAEQAFESLKEEIEAGDTVLIKGSNASGLGQLVKIIRAHKNKGDV